MTTAQLMTPADPNAIAAKSLDDDGWIPYDLGDDVRSGEPNTHASFFAANPSRFNWNTLTRTRLPTASVPSLPQRRILRAARRTHRDHLRVRAAWKRVSPD
jgi:hypothetical protein